MSFPPYSFYYLPPYLFMFWNCDFTPFIFLCDCFCFSLFTLYLYYNSLYNLYPLYRSRYLRFYSRISPFCLCLHGVLCLWTIASRHLVIFTFFMTQSYNQFVYNYCTNSLNKRDTLDSGYRENFQKILKLRFILYQAQLTTNSSFYIWWNFIPWIFYRRNHLCEMISFLKRNKVRSQQINIEIKTYF